MKKLVVVVLIATVVALILASVAFAKAGTEKAEFRANLAPLV